jgi:hypothetical protein
MGFTLMTIVGRRVRRPKVLAELALQAAELVIRSNVIAMQEAARAGRPLPELYDSGVVYEREPKDGFEEFADYETVLERGWGDCDDLVCAKAAELRCKGIPATVRIYWRFFRRTGFENLCCERVPDSVIEKNGGLMPRGVFAVMHVELRHPPSKEYPEGRIEDPSRHLGL